MVVVPVAAGSPHHQPAFGLAEDGDAEARMSRIGVLVAGGQALVRAGYRVLLQSDARVEVIGEAVTGDQAVELAGRTQPDVALLDVGLLGVEDCDGIVRVVSHPSSSRPR
jgi:CheY-like chemotaxis protein